MTLYHAGLSGRERHQAMTAFLDGSARIIAATVAFGMGIDKPDVRWVLHADPPPSLDAYYQEIGRAGRDGQASHVRLLYRYEDFETARHLTARGVSGAAVARAGAALAAGQGTGPGPRQLTAALARLADLGAAAWQADGDVRWTATMTVAAAVEASRAETGREDEVERTRLTMMRRYADNTGCRRSFLLTYFGQDYRGPCGNCDNDSGDAEAAPAEVPFPVGAGARARYSGTTATRSPCCSTSTASASCTCRWCWNATSSAPPRAERTPSWCRDPLPGGKQPRSRPDPGIAQRDHVRPTCSA